MSSTRVCSVSEQASCVYNVYAIPVSCLRLVCQVPIWYIVEQRVPPNLEWKRIETECKVLMDPCLLRPLLLFTKVCALLTRTRVCVCARRRRTKLASTAPRTTTGACVPLTSTGRPNPPCLPCLGRQKVRSFPRSSKHSIISTKQPQKPVFQAPLPPQIYMGTINLTDVCSQRRSITPSITRAAGAAGHVV